MMNIHPIGDGLWYWYANLWRGGKLMYADMHLPLQPLFVELTGWAQTLLGPSWLGSKVLAVLQLLLWCVGIFLVVRKIRWRDGEKAILIAAVFMLTMMASYFRFDDYHITCYIFEIYSILLLLQIAEKSSLFAVTGLGILSGLSLSNRLNDGAALFAVSGFVLLFLERRYKVRSVLLFTAAAAATLLAVVYFSGDSYHQWIGNSITGVAGIKGEPGALLIAPFKFPFTMLKMLFRLGIAANFALFLLFVFLVRFLLHADEALPSQWKRRSALIFLCIAIPLDLFRFRLGQEDMAITIIGIFLCYGLGIVVTCRSLSVLLQRSQERWKPLQLLVLFPFALLLAGAVTSGRSILEAYPAIATLLLVLPLAYPVFLEPKRRRQLFTAIMLLITTVAVSTKTESPYYWHHFVDKTLFVGREWYQHPVHGWMYLDHKQLQFMNSVCTIVGKQHRVTELLAITNPYANYFCDVTPWHGYVQTWYDTASKKTIDQLIADLKNNPPEWIVYQRGLDTMEAHEWVFSGGKPLPHRALDKYILTSIASGAWKVVKRTDFGDADWLVIQTRSAI